MRNLLELHLSIGGGGIGRLQRGRSERRRKIERQCREKIRDLKGNGKQVRPFGEVYERDKSNSAGDLGGDEENKSRDRSSSQKELRAESFC